MQLEACSEVQWPPLAAAKWKRRGNLVLLRKTPLPLKRSLFTATKDRWYRSILQNPRLDSVTFNIKLPMPTFVESCDMTYEPWVQTVLSRINLMFLNVYAIVDNKSFKCPGKKWKFERAIVKGWMKVHPNLYTLPSSFPTLFQCWM